MDLNLKGKFIPAIKPRNHSTDENEETTEQKQKEQFFALMNELRIMAYNDSSYDHDRSRMASMIGEFVNIASTVYAHEKNKSEKLEKHLEKMVDMNKRYRTAFQMIAEKEPEFEMMIE